MRELARRVFQRPSPGKSPRRLPGPSGITGTKRRRWTTRGCLRTSERRPLSLPGQGRSGHRCPKAHSSGLSRAHIGHRSGDSRAASRPYPASAYPRRQGRTPQAPFANGIPRPSGVSHTDLVLLFLAGGHKRHLHTLLGGNPPSRLARHGKRHEQHIAFNRFAQYGPRPIEA